MRDNEDGVIITMVIPYALSLVREAKRGKQPHHERRLINS